MTFPIIFNLRMKWLQNHAKNHAKPVANGSLPSPPLLQPKRTHVHPKMVISGHREAVTARTIMDTGIPWYTMLSPLGWPSPVQQHKETNDFRVTTIQHHPTIYGIG